jgi:hypothetical protein
MSQPYEKKIAFVEDIFIAKGTNHQPVVYRLREDEWKALAPKSEDDIHIPEIANLVPLIRNEVVVADVPRIQEREEYLFINLTALAVNKD